MSRSTRCDVIHAFYVPDFLFKRDAIPGKPTTFDLPITAPGIYRRAVRRVLWPRPLPDAASPSGLSTTADFEAWLAEQAATGSQAP